MSSSTLSWYSINNTGNVLTFSGEKFQVVGDVDITGNYLINGEPISGGDGSDSTSTLGEVLPIGSFINYPWPTSSSDPPIPFGFLRCNGSEISNVVYSDLYAVLGNRYGVPSTPYMFVLPNFSNFIVKYRFTATPSASDLLPIGSIITIPWTITPYPNGFLKCDGSEVSRETYTILYTELGDIYGAGDGSSTFNLPNLFNQGIKYKTTIVSSSSGESAAVWNSDGSFLFFGNRVGIGTVSPRTILDVVGKSSFTGGNVGIGTTNPITHLELRTDEGNGPELRLSESSETYSKISFYGTVTGTSESVHVSSLVATTEPTNDDCRLDFNVGSDGGTILSILGNGRVGIGNTIPEDDLHVEGTAKFKDTVKSSKALAPTSGWTTAVQLDTKILFYDNGGVNWSGMGVDSAGVWWLRTGTTAPNYMVVNPSGNVGIGTTAPGARLEVRSLTQTAAIIRSSSGSAQTDWPSGWSGGLATFDITCAGIYYNTLQQRSDSRLKNNVADMTLGLEDVRKLRPVTFSWNDIQEGKTHYGFIAQEIETVIPQIVSQDSVGIKSINKDVFDPLLVNCIKELDGRIREAESRADGLQRENSRLSEKLETLESLLRDKGLI